MRGDDARGARDTGQAFIFLMMGASGNGAPSPPPTLRELPARNPDVPIRPGGLPAPFLLQQGGQTMPRLSPPAGPQVAQISNEELLRRLERLEEENRRLRQQQSTPQPPTGAGGTADLGSRLPMQTSPGWWVHLHTWNPRGELGQGPIRTMRYPNQRFNMAIGHDPNKRGGQRDEIYIYRFEAWLRVQQAGTYQVGATINCAWNHWCNYLLLIDGVQLADVQGDNSGVSNRLVFAGRHLEPGDYRVEKIFHLTRNQFLNYRPTQAVLEPMIRAPGDMNFRAPRPDEVVVPDRRDVPLGLTIPWD